MSVLEGLATASAVALSFSPLPTMHSIWVNQDTMGYPVEPLMALTAGCIVNLLYGLVTKVEALVVCNAMQLHLLAQLYVYHRAASPRSRRSVRHFVVALLVCALRTRDRERVK